MKYKYKCKTLNTLVRKPVVVAIIHSRNPDFALVKCFGRDAEILADFLSKCMNENPFDQLGEMSQLIEEAMTLTLPHKFPDGIDDCPACKWHEKAKAMGY